MNRGPDLAKIGGAEAVTKRMSWEGFQYSEKIGIEDPPGVAEVDGVPERNLGKIQRNQDEQVKLGTVERMDSAKDDGTDQTPQMEVTKVNRLRVIK